MLARRRLSQFSHRPASDILMAAVLVSCDAFVYLDNVERGGENCDAFHARLRAACAAHDPTFYPRFSKWAEDYFWLPHRQVARGVGGIFYDRLEDHFEEHFAFTRDVGEAFLDIYPQIVRKRMDMPFTDADMNELLEFRGRYVEFNLLYDRGTLFGLKTGGNIDAILMSLPPLAKWK